MTLVAILGGLAAAKSLPGTVTVPLGVGLFLAPGYLWSEALLSQRMPGWERALFAVGLTLILPILGGFLLSAMKIPLFKQDWLGMLVLLTLSGVIAALIQRSRRVREDRFQPERQRRRAPVGGNVALNTFVYGIAAVIGLGAIGYSVQSAEDQQFPGYTMFSMTPVVSNPLADNMAELSNNITAQQQAALAEDGAFAAAGQAHIYVANHENGPVAYQVKLTEQGKVTQTWTFELQDGQSKQITIPYGVSVEMLADLYMAGSSAPSEYVDNGTCVSNLSLLPQAIRSEDPCYAPANGTGTKAPAKRAAKNA